MTKKDSYKLMELIQVFYEKFQFDQHKLDAWYMVLQNYTYDKVFGNLLKFVGNSPHPPKISDLVQTSYEGRYYP